MALRSVLTTDGIQNLWASDGGITAGRTIKYFKIGATLLSESDVVNTITESALGIVFGDPPDAQELPPPVQVGRQITFSIDLGVDVGGFGISNVGLYLDDGTDDGPGTLFAVGALTSKVDKVKSQGTAVGDHWRANFPIIISDDVDVFKRIARDDISITASSRTIATVAGDFSIFSVGDNVTLSGFATAANNGRFEIESIAADPFLSMVVLDPDGVLVDETALEAGDVVIAAFFIPVTTTEIGSLPEVEYVDSLPPASRAADGIGSAFNAAVVTSISALATAKSASPSSYPQWAISGYHVMGILEVDAAGVTDGLGWLDVTKSDWEGILPFDPSEIPEYSTDDPLDDDEVGLPIILVQTNADDADGSLTLPIGRVKAIGLVSESSDNWRLTFESGVMSTLDSGNESKLEAGDSVAIMLSTDYLIRDAIELLIDSASDADALTEVPDEYLTQDEGDTRYLKLSGGTLTGALELPNLGQDVNDNRSVYAAWVKSRIAAISKGIGGIVPASKTANYNVVVADDGKIIEVNAAGAARTVTLPNLGTTNDGFTITIIKTDSSGNGVTIDGYGGHTVNDALTEVLVIQYASVILKWTGSEWFILGASRTNFATDSEHTQNSPPSDKYATPSGVRAVRDALVGGAPGALDVLDELAAALGDDANFANTVNTAIGARVRKAGDTMTGALNLVTPALTDDSKKAVPSEWVNDKLAGLMSIIRLDENIDVDEDTLYNRTYSGLSDYARIEIIWKIQNTVHSSVFIPIDLHIPVVSSLLLMASANNRLYSLDLSDGIPDGALTEIGSGFSSTVDLSITNGGIFQVFTVSGTTYLISATNDQLYSLDLSDGTLTAIGIAFSSTVNLSAGNIFQVFTVSGTTYLISATNDQLYSLDLSDGTLTAIGIAFSSTVDLSAGNIFQVFTVSGTTYLISATNDQLYSLDLSDGTLTAIGSGFTDTVDLSTSSTNGGIFQVFKVSGTTYLISIVDDQLYSLDLSDGTLTAIGSGFTDTVDLSANNNNYGTFQVFTVSGTTYLISIRDDQLYSLDLSDGTLTAIGSGFTDTVNLSVGSGVYGAFQVFRHLISGIFLSPRLHVWKETADSDQLHFMAERDLVIQAIFGYKIRV